MNRVSQFVDRDGSLVRACGEDNRIHRVTIAGRAAHFQPNLTQVRSTNKPYRHRFRDCFETYLGWVFVSAHMEWLGRGFGKCMTPLNCATCGGIAQH
jgi:hypothetical protein